MNSPHNTDTHPNSNKFNSKESKYSWKIPIKKTSLKSLIAWNIKKALENNPHIDLKDAIRKAQDGLAHSSRDVNSLMSRYPEEHHLACALLAWQQLGHSDADSLYSFVNFNQNETRNNIERNVQNSGNETLSDILRGMQNSGNSNQDVERTVQDNGSASCSPQIPNENERSANVFSPKGSLTRSLIMSDRWSVGSESPLGPVLKLPPVEPKIVMRMDSHPGPPNMRKNPKEFKSKLSTPCCVSAECTEKLTTIDKETTELRQRAQRLARREADRAALLERAEAAWRDLETGYQRRLRKAEEKEADLTNQIKNAIEVRNGFKNTCTELVEALKTKSDAAEKDREALTKVEKEVYQRACERIKLSEQVARSDAELAEQTCRVAQLERDLMFKEEEVRRRQQALQNEADSAQAMKHEADRVVREELTAIKDQVEKVGQELLTEDAETERLKQRLEDLLDEKYCLSDELEGCQLACEKQMKGTMDSLKKKREELLELKKKEIECRCKLPIDESVEVKRTPSLAALCQCTPEQKIVDSCSCTSLRSRLLTDLLSELFEGLHLELGDTCSQMPCHLLKCLEDKHNWDRASAVKTSLRNYFSLLLLGELDIAIATSIENYHAKWVGASCADEARVIPAANPMHSSDWQERALELKAQKMATKLAEQLFKEKANELAQQAKNILAKTGRPPCECHPENCGPSSAVYQCLVKPSALNRNVEPSKNKSATPPMYLRQTLEDVTQLRMQVEDLKKDSIKREDLKMMETKIAKMVKFASITSPSPNVTSITEKSVKNEPQMPKIFNVPTTSRYNSVTNKNANKKKTAELNITPKMVNRSVLTQRGVNVPSKLLRRSTQQFAVNMCLYDAKKKSSTQSKCIQQLKESSKLSGMQCVSRDVISQISSPRQTKNNSPQQSFFNDNKKSKIPSCKEDCVCFHKKPSNTSIDKLLETLMRWKEDLVEARESESLSKKQSLNKSIFRIIKKNSKTPQPQNSESLDTKMIDDSEMNKLNFYSNNPSYNGKKNSAVGGNKINSLVNAVIGTELPIVTESVYMGAISLEKSSKSYQNNEDEKFSFKCINSSKSTCKNRTSDPTHNEQGLDVQSFFTNEFIPIENKVEFGGNTDINSSIIKKKNDKGDVTDDVQLPFNDILKCSTMLQSEYENHIKCLGVTLTNIYPTKEISRPIKNITNNLLVGSKNIVDENELTFNYKKPQTENYLNEVCSVTKLDRETNKSDLLQNNKNKTSSENKDRFAVDDSTNEPCICCKHFDVDNSKDLEVNTFQLLEEHLKGKLEEFKHSFCKSSCIPDAEKERLFTTILQRIKQLISDSTSAVNCKCAENSELNGSWNRAYSLLQEYLKTKLERVKCQCIIDNNIKDKKILPNVMKNISYLIENDLQRLKEICKCKNVNNSYVKADSKKRSQDKVKSFILDINDHVTKVPVKQDFMPVFNQNNVKDESFRNIESVNSNHYKQDFIPVFNQNNIKDESFRNIESVNSKNLILSMNNISAQVSPHKMETKSCNAMERQNTYKEAQTINEDVKILTTDGYNSVRSGSECSENAKNETFVVETTETPLSAPLRKPTETEYFTNGDTLNTENKESDIYTDIERLFVEPKGLDVSSKKECKASLPYIGYTMDCCCDSNLGCVCTKSTVRTLNDKLKIEDIWKETNQNAVLSNVSYMLNSTPNKLPTNIDYDEVTKGFDKKMTKTESVHVAKSPLCESEVSATGEKGLTLRESKESVNIAHEITNTVQLQFYRQSKSDYGVAGRPIQCDIEPSKRKSDRIGILKQNKSDDLLFSNDNVSNTTLNIVSRSSNLSTNCDCKMVPLCHVKMLVENIEDKLANAQCTCDSFSSKVCPVHSQKV